MNLSRIVALALGLAASSVAFGQGYRGFFGGGQIYVGPETQHVRDIPTRSVGTPEWTKQTRYTDTDLGINWGNAGVWAWRWAINHEWSAAASYVTGSHNIKVGFQDKDAKETRGPFDVNADLTAVTYRTNVPTSVTVSNYPVFLDPHLNYDVGVYAQDRWAIQRLAATYGLRVQWLNSGVPEVSVSRGRFVGPRTFPSSSR